MPTESADAADHLLVERIRAALRALADPSRAPTMQAYMKSELPCLGVRVPQVRAAVRTQLRERPLACTAALRATVTVLWAQASHREERYAATEVAGAPAVRPMMGLSLSFDHRAMDGAPAAAFLARLKEILETPYLLLL